MVCLVFWRFAAERRSFVLPIGLIEDLAACLAPLCTASAGVQASRTGLTSKAAQTLMLSWC